MGATDQEFDPSKRIPTVIWLVLAVVAVLVFALLAKVTGGHLRHKALVGPPAGSTQGVQPHIVDKGAD